MHSYGIDIQPNQATFNPNTRNSGCRSDAHFTNTVWSVRSLRIATERSRCQPPKLRQAGEPTLPKAAVTLLSGLSAVIWVAAVLPILPACADDLTNLGIGIDCSSGRYGTASTTRACNFPAQLDALHGPWELKITVSAISRPS
jgi:hypothetical protein